MSSTPLDRQHGSAPFRPRARLLKLIGEELISDEVLAITELVKNAHDADATTVTIAFRGVREGGGEIVVTDDGAGMDLDTVLGRWMQPAGSSKRSAAGRRTTAGRRALGEKGVGRFAADKLAAVLELTSRRAGERREVHAIFHWDLFDDEVRMLQDVEVRWEQRPAETLVGSGTQLVLRELRAPWTERAFRRLCLRLARLRTPKPGNGGFRIVIESDEFPEYAGELRNEFLARAPHAIEASFDGEQTVRIALAGEDPVEHPWNGHGDLSCGPLRVRLHAFDLETEALARIGPRQDVRAWLREWAGISIYRDGFRVWPYGEPHDDWLRLDQRRVNNPVLRLSNNQVVGFVEITRDDNPGLMDQTNREGLIHNAAFEDLRRFMYFVLQTLESHRQSRRHPKEPAPTPERATAAAVSSPVEDLEAFARNLDARGSAELLRIAGRLRALAAQRERREQQLRVGLSDLAAAGQSAAVLRRMLDPVLDRLRAGCRDLRQDARWSSSSELRTMEEATATLSQRLALLDAQDAPTHERRRTIELRAECERFRETVEALLDDRGAQLRVTATDDVPLRVDMRPEVLHRVLLALTTNALEHVPSDLAPRLRIALERDDEAHRIVFSDNGPGIPAAQAERVFEPQFTTREGARGMGLTVARSLVEAHGGTLSVLRDGRRRGASLLVRLPRKRPRATAG